MTVGNCECERNSGKIFDTHTRGYVRRIQLELIKLFVTCAYLLRSCVFEKIISMLLIILMPLSIVDSMRDLRLARSRRYRVLKYLFYATRQPGAVTVRYQRGNVRRFISAEAHTSDIAIHVPRVSRNTATGFTDPTSLGRRKCKECLSRTILRFIVDS